MTSADMTPTARPEHASAVRRLASARQEEARLTVLSSAAAGTQAEPLAQERLSASHAAVAVRKQWLHWVDEGESLAPWADGEWAPRERCGPPSHAGNLQGIKDGIARGEAALIRAVAEAGEERDA
jgi:hypothetical protein